MTEKTDYQICRCLRIDCWHPFERCDEPPVIRGGQCRTCHDYVAPPKCPTCGQKVEK